jgi:hypothetical protein
MINVLLWFFHWLGQGLKLCFFSALAWVYLLPLYLPLGFLENGAFEFDGLGTPGKLGVVVGYILCYAVGLAIFTAVLASQLSDDPLRPFQRSGNSELDPTDQSNQAGQKADA